MMKLVLIFAILFSLFLFMDKEEESNAAKQELTAGEQFGKLQCRGAEFSEINLRAVWVRAYILMWKSLAHVKQADQSEDQGVDHEILYKTLHSGVHSALISCGPMFPDSEKFMRLLSERHVKGFYIYSLGELII